MPDVQPEGRHGAIVAPEYSPGPDPDRVGDLKAITDMTGEFCGMVFFFPPGLPEFLDVEFQGKVQGLRSDEKILVYLQRILKGWYILILGRKGYKKQQKNAWGRF